MTTPFASFPDGEDLIHYQLVITPEPNKKAWRGPWDAEGRAPQIRRASFFPSTFAMGLDTEGGEALHAVKNSQGLLAKEFIVLKQKLPRVSTPLFETEQASTWRTQSLGARASLRGGETHIQAGRVGSSSVRLNGVLSRRVNGDRGDVAEGPKVVAILRGSNSGSHYLLASCAPKAAREEDPPISGPLKHPLGAAVHARSPLGQSSQGEASWKQRVFASASGAVNSGSSAKPTSTTGEKRKSLDGAKTEEVASPTSDASSPTEPAGSWSALGSGMRQRRPGMVLQQALWRGSESYHILSGLQSEAPAKAEDEPSPVGNTLVKASHQGNWLAARRHAFTLSACWNGSAYELATDTDIPDVLNGAQAKQGSVSAVLGQTGSEGAVSVPHMSPSSVDHSPQGRGNVFRESSPPHRRPRWAHMSLYKGADSPGFENAVEGVNAVEGDVQASTDSQAGPLAQIQGASFRGLSLRKLSNAKDEPSSGYLGTPELAIRFYRPGHAKSFMPPSMRAMGPGEGYVPAETSHGWVMEGLPSGVFRQLASFTGLGGHLSTSESEIRTQVREDASGEHTSSVQPLSAFIGEPGAPSSGCLLAMYGANPCRPALEMKREFAQAGSRCISFSVALDISQVSVMQAFAFCLARADSLVAGGTAAGI